MSDWFFPPNYRNFFHFFERLFSLGITLKGAIYGQNGERERDREREREREREHNTDHDFKVFSLGITLKGTI